MAASFNEQDSLPPADEENLWIGYCATLTTRKMNLSWKSKYLFLLLIYKRKHQHILEAKDLKENNIHRLTTPKMRYRPSK